VSSGYFYTSHNAPCAGVEEDATRNAAFKGFMAAFEAVVALSRRGAGTVAFAHLAISLAETRTEESEPKQFWMTGAGA